MPVSLPPAWRPTGAGYLDRDGQAWRSMLPATPEAGAGRAALFLDRDGVVVVEVDYLRRVGDVRLIDGAAGVITAARDAGLAVILVTNQSGVGRGYFGWPEFEAVQAEIARQLHAAGAEFDAVYACGIDPRSDSAAAEHADWRKPGPGMLRAAIADFDIAPARSVIFGDRASDLAAGKAAGLAGGVLVETGYGHKPSEQEAAARLAGEVFRTTGAADIAAAWPLALALLAGER